MRTLLTWIEWLIDRLLVDGTGDAWRPVVSHHRAARAGEAQPRVWLTVDGEKRPQSIHAWPELAEGDRLAVEALLAQPGVRWFNEATRELATVPPRERGRSISANLATAVIIRGFDGSWTPGAGGWLRLRFLGGLSCASYFGAAEGELFSRQVTAASVPEAMFDPRTRSIRSRATAASVGELAVSR
jgi:hypothetical protein